MTTTNPMTRIYERLKAIGITRKYAHAVALPVGWRDDETTNPAVYAQALGLLARNLNLDLRSLLANDQPVTWKDCGSTRFLKHGNIPEEALVPARCLSVRAAQVAVLATPVPAMPLPNSAQTIRDTILSRAEVVDFRALLVYCWESGIPVLHVSRFPEGVKKPMALAAQFARRPAIILCGKHKYAAWMLFRLAHELGHIVRGHLDDTGVLVDEKIVLNSEEAHEEEATACAFELLTGKPDILYRASTALSAAQLADSARRVGKRDQIDSGFIALNYAHNEGRFDIGNKAVELLGEGISPVSLIYEEMEARLCWSELSRENREFLRRITEP